MNIYFQHNPRLIDMNFALHKEFRTDIMKILIVFKGRINALAAVSDTEASAGFCDGAACVACLIPSVENKKF
jgi:hypothetical protein